MNIFKWLWPAKPKYTSNEMEVEKLAHDINRTFDHLRDIHPVEIDQMEASKIKFTTKKCPLQPCSQDMRTLCQSHITETIEAKELRIRIIELERKLDRLKGSDNPIMFWNGIGPNFIR